LVDAQHLPHGRRQVGDRHLKFHETRDNLGQRVDIDTSAWTLLVPVVGDPASAQSSARWGLRKR
jgi:hypothetical protein